MWPFELWHSESFVSDIVVFYDKSLTIYSALSKRILTFWKMCTYVVSSVSE